jgi:hypothetical protein
VYESLKNCYDFRTRTSITADVRNLKAKTQIDKRCGEYYSVKYICTHAWKERGRGNGEREYSRTRGIDCPASITATVQLQKRNGLQSVHITKMVTYHNHPVDEETWSNYPEMRAVKCPEVLGTVSDLVKVGTKSSTIFRFIQQQGGKFTKSFVFRTKVL